MTATETETHRTVSEYFAIFKSVVHSLEPGETPGNSDIQPMSIGLPMLFIYSFICFLRAGIISNVKVVPIDAFGGERVNLYV